MIRVRNNLLQLMLLVLVVLVAAMPAEAKMKPVPKVDNFILFQDYSGSMAMTHLQARKVKIVMAKDLLFAMNDAIPELGYNSSLHTFAPFSELLGMQTYNKSAMEAAIGTIETDYEIFNRRTPMGLGISSLRPVLDTLSGKTAIILISDGAHNLGIDPVAEAQSIYATYPNVCFHCISFADEPYGQGVLEQIAALNGCSCGVHDGVQMLADSAAIDAFLQCAIYEMKNVCGDEIIQLGNILFDFDRAAIKNEMKPILDEAVAIINENSDCVFEIQGHTCSIGSEQYNQGLSERRAQSVVDYLVAAGVAPASLRAVGYGETMPTATNDTREGRRLNRRVEIHVMDQ